MGKILLAKRGNLVKNYINANAFWIFINGINQTRADGIPPKTLS
jgi:hypothetical protein